MNVWQVTQSLKHKLQTVAWTLPSGHAAGSTDVVFGITGVHIYAGTPPSEEDIPPAFPFALITVDMGSPDSDSADIIEQQFSIVVAVQTLGDPLGEQSIIGGPRPDRGKSPGAGLLEVLERVYAAIGELTAYDGSALIVSSTGSASPQPLGRGRHVAFEEISVTATCTALPLYAAPEQLKVATVDAQQVWTWEGAHCSSRFDFRQYRFGYKTGSTAVDTVEGLTATLYAGASATFTHTPVAGRVYQVFTDYDPRGVGLNEYNSVKETGSFKVVPA